MTVHVRAVRPDEVPQAARMRAELWPEATVEEHSRDVERIASGVPVSTLPLAFLVAEVEEALAGFVEIGLRSHADGCDPSRPVGFVEGWFVAEDARGRGVGRALIDAAAAWAAERGCRELASDTWAANAASRAAHEALGFSVVDECVNYRRPIPDPRPRCTHVLTIVAVSDVVRAATFYERAFGWHPDVVTDVYRELRIADGRRFGLYARDAFARNIGVTPPRAPDSPTTATEIYVSCDDLLTTIERLEALGAPCLSPLALRPWGDEVAYFADLDGNVLAVTRPAQPTTR